MQKKTKWLLLAISLTLFSLFSGTALGAEVIGVESSEVMLTDSMMQWGPGSQLPLRSPNEPEYVWVSSVEPVKAVWTIYNPGMREITKLEHPVSLKQRIPSGEHAGKWGFADETAFTIPAFAEKGTWYAKYETHMADGSVQSGVSAENPNYKYISFSVTSSGDVITNLFGAPWYLFGMAMPPVFWFPLILLWGPAIFIGLCYISPWVSETFKKSIDRIQEARKKW